MKKIIIILAILLVIGSVILFAMNSDKNSKSTNYDNNIEQLSIEEYSPNGADLIAEIANKMIEITK